MNFEIYKNTLPYPEKPNNVSKLKRQRFGFDPLKNSKDARMLVEAVEADEREMVEYVEQIDLYRTEEMRRHRQFKFDLFEELGISDNPKAELLFSKAWDRGHSDGYYAVFNVAVDLMDLII